jgi:predicted small secreted protein
METPTSKKSRHSLFWIAGTAVLLGLFGAIVGCNTMEGLGEDIERGGEKLQEKAR